MIKTRGELPATEVIVLESCKEQWGLFAKGLTKKLSTTGIIQKDDKKFRIKIEILVVKRPEDFQSITHVMYLKTPESLDSNSSEGIRRSQEFFAGILDKNTWILIGYVEGENHIPIVISHYENLNISVYSMQLADQSMNEFFKNFPPLNLN